MILLGSDLSLDFSCIYLFIYLFIYFILVGKVLFLSDLLAGLVTLGFFCLLWVFLLLGR